MLRMFGRFVDAPGTKETDNVALDSDVMEVIDMSDVGCIEPVEVPETDEIEMVDELCCGTNGAPVVLLFVKLSLSVGKTEGKS